ncbi:MAG: tRNA (adenosine(37)-N6)-dimethylallyltransferase MiaA [Christensenella sp.]
MKDKVYVITGPTAAGKTAVAIALAKCTNGEIISADSMQIYREMNIGTAKPTFAEREGIVHHMLDIASPNKTYSVAMFQRGAKGWIKDILRRGKTPIIAGGTGLYINALTYQLDFTKTSHNTALRSTFEGREAGELYEELKEKDPSAAERIHQNDKKRIIRRLEIASNNSDKEKYNFRIPNDEYDFVMAGLTTERKVLYERINARVDNMLELGIIKEAQQLFAKYGDMPNSMLAIGYKEFIPYFEGNSTLAETVELLKKNSRHYAKRQLTWFRRDERIKWYDVILGTAQIAEQILNQR